MKRLEAPEGKYYTQAGDIAANRRVFAKVVFLGCNDAPENWRLSDDAERFAVEAEARAMNEDQ